jgi:hypothetical protein
MIINYIPIIQSLLLTIHFGVKEPKLREFDFWLPCGQNKDKQFICTCIVQWVRPMGNTRAFRKSSGMPRAYFRTWLNFFFFNV